MEFSELCERAFSVVAPRKLSETAEAGTVGAALETDSGNVYVGVCMDISCSIGFARNTPQPQPWSQPEKTGW